MSDTPMTQEQVGSALARLGLTGAEFQRIPAMPYPDAVKALEALQAAVKKQYRSVALELHPDRTGNDPVKTEEFTRVTAVFDKIEQLRLVQRPQVVPFMTGTSIGTVTTVNIRNGSVTVHVTVR